MRVIFNRKCEYPQNDASQSRVYLAGETYDLPESHARRWLRRGFADEAPPEVAAEPTPEPAPPEVKGEPKDEAKEETKPTKKSK